MAQREYHIVHIESVEKVADGQKPAEMEQRRKAQAILLRLRTQLTGEKIVYIENPSRLDCPPPDNVKVVIGGAFDGQCLADYQKTLEENQIEFERDENLILR